jgi:hypothetical protein
MGGCRALGCTDAGTTVPIRGHDSQAVVQVWSMGNTLGVTIALRMIDRTKSSTLLYQNTGILDAITTVGQHRSSLSYDYLIILKRVHVAKDTEILGCRLKLTLVIVCLENPQGVSRYTPKLAQIFLSLGVVLE